jgi:hypothetical protein
VWRTRINTNKNKTLVHTSRLKLKPRMNLMAKARSNLTDLPIDRQWLYSLLKDKCVNIYVKRVLYKALNISLIVHDYSTWEYAAETYLFKLQRLQNRFCRAIVKLYKRTPVREMHMHFKIPYVYDYVTKLCRKQAEAMESHLNHMCMQLDNEKPCIGSMRGLNLPVVKLTITQVTNCTFGVVKYVKV